MKKRILFYAHYYIPDVASTGQICADLAEGLVDDFDVTVICVVPSYSGKIDEKYKNKKAIFYFEQINGVHVVRVKVPEFDKNNKISRIKNIVSYFFNARKATRALGGFDYVFAISQPPILGGMLGVYGAKKKKAKFIYNIQDVNPEQIMAVGYSHNKILMTILMRIDKRSCRKANLVITVGRDLVETINNRFKNDKNNPQVQMINNWADEKLIYPLPMDDAGVEAFKKQYGLENKFIFMYSGNIGLYYDLEGLMTVIEKIKPGTKSYDGREVVFAFVGDGSILIKLKDYKEKHHMDNVVFIPYQDKNKLVYSLNAADVHFCLSAKGIKGISCPSKYYGIAACKKPVIGVMEEDSEVGLLIRELNNGLLAKPGDYDGIEKIIRLCFVYPQVMDNNVLISIKLLHKELAIQKYKGLIEVL